MQFRILAALPPALFLTSAMGCSGALPGGETSGDVTSAVTSGGVGATLTVTSQNSQQIHGTITVQNNGAEPASNWQVAVNLNQSTLAQGTSGAEARMMNGLAVFTPDQNARTLSPGASTSFNFSTAITGSSHVPAVTLVDGVAPGTANSGNPADGVDHIARGAANGAFEVALAYENDKIAGNGDPNYKLYDRLIWSAHSYRVASDGATIEFDPNVPGYAFVPASSKAALAIAQLDPSVASYLATGLLSCLSDVTSAWVYALRADFLKGFVYPGPSTGSVVNKDGSTDTFTVTGAPGPNCAQQITVTAHSDNDSWFGIVTYNTLSSFPNSQAVASKYTGTYQASCSPFNGPGGTANPYLVIKQNGNAIAPRYQGQGTSYCQYNGGCTGSLVVDPVPYSEPGVYYDVAGQLTGMQSNPFVLDPSVVYADSSHATQWATRTVAGVQQWGTFSTPVSRGGITVYKYLRVM
jgi:Cellulose binding domain